MLCQNCKKSDTKVIDSREMAGNIRRRRECLKCGFRFTTYEKFEIPNLKIRKKDGRVEEYDRKKIESGIKKSLTKDECDDQRIAEILDDIEQEIIQLNLRVADSQKIGEIVAKKLKKFDEVAYLRFVSVYKSISSAKNFEKEVKKLVRRSDAR
ncbi:MAG: transcriptional regulator NrdR [Candidatus Berkelbacteria bacterium]|nr:transcriptional regulator NrdR [Candidatus Berkelbacteria bacterium]